MAYEWHRTEREPLQLATEGFQKGSPASAGVGMGAAGLSTLNATRWPPETTMLPTVVLVMSLSTNAAALDRCGLTESDLAALAAGTHDSTESMDLVVLNGAATIVNVDREVGRYLAMRRGPEVRSKIAVW